MEVSLASAVRRWLFVAGVFLLAAGLTFGAGRHWLAEHWASSAEPRNWVRVAGLEPGNAAHWHRLGRFRLLDFEETNLAQAITYLQRATELHPGSATYWMELARAYELNGEFDQAGQSFEKAKASYPISSAVAWAYGNFLLRQGQFSEAFAEIRRALAVDPQLTLFAVALCWRVSGDVEAILDQVLPSQSAFYFQALYYFVSQQEIDAALTTWNRFLALNEPFALRRAFPLLEVLIRQHRMSLAREIWQQALHRASQERESADNSLIWNGGFEAELLNGGFGWRQQAATGALFDIDTNTYRSGVRSLRISFEGTTNVDFQHLIQYVPVEPRNRYHFTAFLRTEGISTDSGIRFRIFDLRRPAELDILTPNLIGSQNWEPQEAELTTGPKTRLVGVALRRLPSRKLDNKLRGRVWVDDVSLRPVDSLSAHRSP